MKKFILPAVMSIALFSCGKKNKFECDLPTVDLPATDTASLRMPNAFSPNHDGLNDHFFFLTNGIKSIHWEVYSQDNEMVFSTSSLTEYWEPNTAFADGLTPFQVKLEATTDAGNKISRCAEIYVYTCVPRGYSMARIIFGDQYNFYHPEEEPAPVSHEWLVQCKD
jgi:hypothetical protein